MLSQQQIEKLKQDRKKERENKPGVPIRCQRCKFEWTYRGNNVYVTTCHHCSARVWINKNRLDGKGIDYDRNVTATTTAIE